MMKLLSRRKLIEFYLGLMNHPSTPERVARGVAIGLCCAFIIPIFQMMLAFLLSIICKGARFSALLFTWVSNPFTIPLIYPLQCYVGSHLIGRPVSYETVKQSLSGVFWEPSFRSYSRLGRELLEPFLVGGLVLGLLVSIVGYFLSKTIIIKFRARKRRRIMQRKEQIAHLHANKQKG